MKVLFIVQGEGRGHLTQAISMEKLLRSNGHEVMEVLVGKSESRRLPGFFTRNIQAPVRQFTSPNFLPTHANKRVNLTRSVLYNLMKLPEYAESICFIHHRIQETEADLVLNFYELLTGLTYLFFRPSVPQICIGHQYLFLHPQFKLPKKNKGSLFMLNFFTRLTALGASQKLALSFRAMPQDKHQHISVVPPLLRQDVLQQESQPGDYIHGYMLNAGFSENILQWHQKHPEVPLRFFWDHWEEEPVKKIDDTLSFYQLDDVEFLRQMAGCKAYASTAGFESVCEAMYLGKPILMVPAHIEQECNAFDAQQNGAGIIDRNFNLSNLLRFSQTYKPNRPFTQWVRSAEYIILNEIERFVPQNNLHGMYMVEEFV
ncbi:glycosyltransferase family protein [uncultured Bacteroides sp.]|uniref:glycosyltransferase family protein n=1 Tax=uncultured Bacteroides sp. TaxID=162156 RepID=UPI00280B92FD|nr:glycosyltransferase family protein [uncultured Bacteroides sp.]